MVKSQGARTLDIFKLSTQPSSSLVITHSVRIQEDLTWNLSVHGCQVDPLQCGLLASIPENVCLASLKELLKLLDECAVCPGNPDAVYVEMVESKKGKLMSRDRKRSLL